MQRVFSIHKIGHPGFALYQKMRIKKNPATKNANTTKVMAEVRKRLKPFFLEWLALLFLRAYSGCLRFAGHVNCFQTGIQSPPCPEASAQAFRI